MKSLAFASLSVAALLFGGGCTKVLKPDNPEYATIVTQARAEADNYLKTHTEYYDRNPHARKPDQRGYCYTLWDRMKQIIRKKHGFEWKDPSEENPDVTYD